MNSLEEDPSQPLLLDSALPNQPGFLGASDQILSSDRVQKFTDGKGIRIFLELLGSKVPRNQSVYDEVSHDGKDPMVKIVSPLEEVPFAETSERNFLRHILRILLILKGAQSVTKKRRAQRLEKLLEATC
jgi:hypothetical protein